MRSSQALSTRPRPVVLCILDGWGVRAEREDNAIALARMPNWDRYAAAAPMARLEASAGHVGLPEGQMGNSEVGHVNIGAGRVVDQELPRIDKAVADGSLARHPLLLDLAAVLRANGGACHLLGLLSPGGVHSHQDQMAALARVVGEAGVPVRVHAILDGRDAPPRSALPFLERFLAGLPPGGQVGIATVGGRYYAMDRDRRWERTLKAYRTLVDAEGARAGDALTAVRAAYAEGTSDEFVAPTALDGYAGMKDGDGLVVANFRADRARQILSALVDPDFDGFQRPRRVRFASLVGMVEYSERLGRFLGTLFPPQNLDHILGQVVADAGLAQLRIAETEKYAHVTFFLNGGREEVFPGEERILVPSPKVATYDLQPEMSAPEVTDKLVAAIRSRRFDLIVVNYANGDMVGHTGVLAAAVKAAETVDACLGRVEAAVRETGGVLVITADHGNLEQMRDAESGQPHTAHTTNRVPLIVVNAPAEVAGLDDGCLSDVAPTLLDLLGLPRPAEMTGRSLIARADARSRAGAR